MLLFNSSPVFFRWAGVDAERVLIGEFTDCHHEFLLGRSAKQVQKRHVPLKDCVSRLVGFVLVPREKKEKEGPLLLS